ncbi:hypothetical protein [Jeotgalibacillus aurantiacus]|uniref:hypothetical protein n=1 Tax=Jeotgalibacillus aurantiacus TaxID=2763266 RepID=UPI001D0A6945|nr:hypothetical protein [Jeotgalibacillus aurantiacus]
MIKRNLDEFFYSKIWMLVIVCIVYTFYSVQIKSVAISFNIDYWEYFLLSMSDQYYTIYFMMLSFLLMIFYVFKKSEEIVWIRAGTYFRFFVSNILSVASISAAFVAVHVLITLVMGLGLSVNNTYTVLPDDSRFTFSLFASYFDTPFLAAMGTVIYLIFGLTFLGVLFLFLKQYFKDIQVILILIVVFISVLLSLRSDLDQTFPYLFFNNFLILHHATSLLDHQYYRFFIVGSLSSMIGMWIIKNYWNKTIDGRLSKFRLRFMDKWNLSMLLSRKNVTFIILLLVFTPIATLLKGNDITTFYGLLYSQFAGHGTGYFFYLNFLQMIIFNGIPLYILCYFIESEGIKRSYLLLIRMKYKKSWVESLVRSGSLFIALYVTFTIGIILITSLIFGLSFAVDDGVSILGSSLMIVTLKIAELIFCFLCIFLLYCYTKSVIFSFLSVIFSYLLCVFTGAIIRYLPFGMSSLERIREFSGSGDLSFFTSFIILSLGCLILYQVIKKNALYRIYQ